MKRFFIFLLLFIAMSVNAETVYTTTDSQGNTTYSDTPINNAKIMIIPNTNTVTSSPNKAAPINAPSTTTSTATATEVVEEAKKPYTTFLIVSPEDQQTFQNQRDIPVKIKVVPDLQSGDKIQLYSDGKPSGEPIASVNLQINQLDRGTHTVTAAIVDKQGGVLKITPTITIFIHYAALGTGIVP